MAVKKTIAIVGANEKKGIEITRRLADFNYRLLLLSNDVTALKSIFEELLTDIPIAEMELIDCMKDGCWEADIIIIAVAERDHKNIAEKIGEVATQKIVAFAIPEQWASNNLKTLQQLFPHSRVVAVISGIDPADIFIEGQDEEAIQTMSVILSTAGYQPIIKGNLL